MNPQQHREAAEKWLKTSHEHTDTGSRADDRIAELSALQAIAHALLAGPAEQTVQLTYSVPS